MLNTSYEQLAIFQANAMLEDITLHGKTVTFDPQQPIGLKEVVNVVYSHATKVCTIQDTSKLVDVFTDDKNVHALYCIAWNNPWATVRVARLLRGKAVVPESVVNAAWGVFKQDVKNAAWFDSENHMELALIMTALLEMDKAHASDAGDQVMKELLVEAPETLKIIKALGYRSLDQVDLGCVVRSIATQMKTRAESCICWLDDDFVCHQRPLTDVEPWLHEGFRELVAHFVTTWNIPS